MGNDSGVTPVFGPPLSPMLARLRDELPEGREWIYEPKWDGFRALVFVHAGSIRLVSRDGRALERYFPELLPALDEALPPECVVDGEILVTTAGGLDFDALLLRIHPAVSRIELLASETPAAFVMFDLLAVGAEDLRQSPFSKRRARLVELTGKKPRGFETGVGDVLAPKGTRVLLTPQTADVARARELMERFETKGLDGIVAKRLDQPYKPGKRDMVKVKLQRTADCVVGGYRLSKAGDGVGSLLLGLYDSEGTLQYAGHTSSFSAGERRALLKELRPLEGGRSFGSGRAPGGPSRWSHGRDDSWVPVEPKLVCEVAYDRIMGVRFRHAVRFLRWRPDKPPSECRFDQVGG
jgi:ATP-dependent DNA ligase